MLEHVSSQVYSTMGREKREGHGGGLESPRGGKERGMEVPRMSVEAGDRTAKISVSHYWSICAYMYLCDTVRRCFCGSAQDPKAPRLATPHSCGNPCSRTRVCGHPCPLPCHPGPCPPCMITIQNPCHCGRDVVALVCSRANPTTGGKIKLPASRSCGRKCGKPLSCQNHVCPELCHDGECPPCSVTEHARCWCGKERKLLACGEGDFKECNILTADGEESWTGKFGCDKPCGRSVFLCLLVYSESKLFLDPSPAVFTNVQRCAIHPHLSPPTVLILPLSLLTVHAANTPFPTQPPHPISVATRSSFARPVLIRFQRVCLYARDHLKVVRIPAARHAILVHVLRVRSHLFGHVVVGRQRVPLPAAQRRQRRSQRLFCAIGHAERCGHVDIINVLVYAVH